VIHAQRRIIGAAHPWREQRIAGDGAEGGDPFGLQGGDGGRNHARFFIPELPTFARVGVQRRNRKARGQHPEITT